MAKTGGYTEVITSSKTRPNDTTAYAANDAIAESASAGTAWTFSNVARVSGGTGIIIGVEARTTDSAQVNRLEIDLYSVAPTAINDNAEATQLVANVANYLGTLTLGALAKKTTNSTFAQAQDFTVRLPFKCAAGTGNLIGTVRTLDAVTPVASTVWYVTLYATQD